MIFEELKESGFEFKKRFGQNFISDANLLAAIVKDAEIGAEDHVLEIGVGAGTLTENLAANAFKVAGVEIDKALQPFLNKKFESAKNIQLVFDDILKMPNERIAGFFDGHPFKIVANLPYYITTPIIFKFVEWVGVGGPSDIIIMVQKEVGDRIVASPGSKDYGVLSVKIQAFGNARITRIVSRKNFRPEPNVDSCVLRITRISNKLNIKDAALFNKVVDSAFSMRRKTLVNNLMKGFGLERLAAEQVLTACKIDVNIRGEVLTPEQFNNITENLLKFAKSCNK